MLTMCRPGCWLGFWSASFPEYLPMVTRDAEARHRYLMTYDIADPKRLRRICTPIQDNGEPLQYPVCLCDRTIADSPS